MHHSTDGLTLPSFDGQRMSTSIVSSARALWMGAALLIVGVVIGVAAALSHPASLPAGYWQRELNARLAVWPGWTMFASHNIGIAALAALGRGSSGVLAGLLTLLTGFTIGEGIVAAYQRGYPPLIIASLVLPHGGIEIWGLLLAFSFGLGGLAMKSAGDNPGTRTLVSAVLLLALAAWLESHVTPYCVRLAMS